MALVEQYVSKLFIFTIFLLTINILALDVTYLFINANEMIVFQF